MTTMHLDKNTKPILLRKVEHFNVSKLQSCICMKAIQVYYIWSVHELFFDFSRMYLLPTTFFLIEKRTTKFLPFYAFFDKVMWFASAKTNSKRNPGCCSRTIIYNGFCRNDLNKSFPCTCTSMKDIHVTS